MRPRFLAQVLAPILVAQLAACANSGIETNATPQLRSATIFNVSGASGFPIPSLALSNSRGVIDLFNSKEQMYGAVHGAPNSGFLAMDKQGDIYLVDTADQYAGLTIFKPPYNGTPVSISFGSNGQTAVDVAVDWRTGVFAVTAQPDDPEYTSAIYFFRHGETKPCATVGSGNFIESGAAFDAQGTFYTSVVLGNSQFEVVSVSGECSPKGLRSYSPTLPYVYTIQFNLADQVVLEESDGFTNPPIVTLAHPTNGVLGKQISSTTLKEIDGTPAEMFCLTSDGKDLWALGFNGNAGLYRYPEGGAPLKMIYKKRAGPGAVYPQLIP